MFNQNNTKENMKEIIGYKLIKPEYNNAAIKLAGMKNTSWIGFKQNLFKKGNRNCEYYEKYVENFKKAGVLDLWFEPYYTQEEKIINIGFDVKITSEGIFHRRDNITEFVEKMYKEFNCLSAYTFGNYKAKFKDIIWESTGCQNIETKLSDWKKIWEIYQEMIK
jgi:hypothetical protein